MYWKKVVIPPNKERYLKSCDQLRRNLESPNPMPAVMIANACWYVMRDCFGGELKALWWIVLSLAERWWSKIQDDSWLFWQKRIRHRSKKQIAELALKRAGKLVAVDLNECSRLVDEAEFEEWLGRMLCEDKDDQ